MAIALPPSGRRARWVIVTTGCPYCQTGQHIHVSADEDGIGGVRRAGCGRGRYWLAVGRG